MHEKIYHVNFQLVIIDDTQDSILNSLSSHGVLLVRLRTFPWAAGPSAYKHFRQKSVMESKVPMTLSDTMISL